MSVMNGIQDSVEPVKNGSLQSVTIQDIVWIVINLYYCQKQSLNDHE